MIKRSDPAFDARLAEPQNRAMAEVLANIGRLGLGAFGVGAGIRGIKGLGDLVAGTTGDPPKVPLRRQFVDVPIARRRPREQPGGDGPLRMLAKQALEGVPAPGPVPAPDLMTQGAGRVLDGLGAFGKDMGTAATAFWNPLAKAWHQHPWAVGTAALGLPAALLAGHAVADKAIGAAQANEDDSELEQAKRRYEHALGGKLAAAEGEDDPYAGLDRAWEVLEKAASIYDDLGGPLGVAGAGLGTVGLLSGMTAYNYVRDRAPDVAVAKALKERRERLFAAGPPALVAVPREAEEPDDPTPRIDLGGIRRRIDALRAPKEAAGPMACPPPAQVGTEVLGQLHQQQEQLRLRARAALGIKEEAAEAPKPAEPMPHRPPSVATALNPQPA